MKPGIKTTEFWLTLAAQLTGIAALMGWITPEQADATTQAVGQIAGAIITVLAAFGYGMSRAKAKAGGQESK